MRGPIPVVCWDCEGTRLTLNLFDPPVCRLDHEPDGRIVEQKLSPSGFRCYSTPCKPCHGTGYRMAWPRFPATA